MAEAPLAILEITYFFKSLTGAPLSQAPLAQAPLSQAPLAIFRSSYVFGWGSFGRGSFGQAPLTRLLWHRLLQLPVSSFLIIFCSKNKIQTKVGRKSKKICCWFYLLTFLSGPPASCLCIPKLETWKRETNLKNLKSLTFFDVTFPCIFFCFESNWSIEFKSIWTKN